MTTDWPAQMTTPAAQGLLAALRRRDPGLPAWPESVQIFADYDARAMQDRTLRALVLTYQTGDQRAGPVILGLLWRRILARCSGDTDRAETIATALLEVCHRAEIGDQQGLPLRLLTAAVDRITGRGPLVRITPMEELVPADGLLMPETAAEALGVDSRTLTRWAEAGRIQATRTAGGHYRYPRSEVERLRSNPPHRPPTPTGGGKGGK